MAKFRIFCRASGIWYIQNWETGKQHSLRTRKESEATRLSHAKNEAYRQPGINIQIARAYFSAADPAIASRTWQFVMDEVLKTVQGPTKDRWLTAIKDPAYTALTSLPPAETRAELFLKALHEGTVATNIFLRRLHNFALNVNWLLGPVIPKRQWPPVRYKEKRAIAANEHRRIVERKTKPERRRIYELCWHLGGSQSDVASLRVAFLLRRLFDRLGIKRDRVRFILTTASVGGTTADEAASRDLACDLTGVPRTK